MVQLRLILLIKKKTSGSGSSCAASNGGLDGWMDTAYQYHTNEHNHEETLACIDSLNDLCSKRFRQMEQLINKLDEKVDKLDVKLDKILINVGEDEINTDESISTDMNSNGSRC